MEVGSTSPRTEMMQRVKNLENDIGWGMYCADQSVCRWTNIMTGLGLKKTPYEFAATDMLGLQFVSFNDAEEFFQLYAKALGFGVRKSHKKKNVRGAIISRTWLCSKEGFRNTKYIHMPARKKEAKLLTREGCSVMFRVTAMLNGMAWKVSKFVTEHSHGLAASPHNQFIGSNRKIGGGGALQTAEAMHSAGIRKCNIMGFMAAQVGGYNNVQFLIKDLYNKMSPKDHAPLGDGHASTAIGYLHHKSTIDTEFYGKFSVDGDNKLENLFWADSRSRVDYKHFGHTLAFDSTYRTNMYGKPLLVLVGISSHFRTIIFGFCLLVNETRESYMWALSTFLECMDGKRPSTVITDGDLAIRAAIKALMPNSVHRLCSLHLLQNVTANIKDQLFPAAFKKLMMRHYTEDDFDKEWHDLISRFGIEKTQWAAAMYDKRHSWAETFLRGHFFGGMITTQRSEGMHAYLKGNVKSSATLIHLIRSLDNAIAWLRVKDANEDYLSRNCKPVSNVTNMREMEQQMTEIFTRRMFYKVRDEMKREGMYLVSNVLRGEDVVTFELMKYTTTKAVRSVHFNKGNNTYHCTCYGFPTTGIPCRHIFASMKFMHVTVLPETLICSRWTNKAREGIIGTIVGDKPWEKKIVHKEAMFGHLISKTTELSYSASLDRTRYKYALQEIEKLVNHLRGMPQSDEQPIVDEVDHAIHMPTHVDNPAYATAKGSGLCGRFGGKRKKCSNCHQTGHNKKTCMLPTNSRQRQQEMAEDLLSNSPVTKAFTSEIGSTDVDTKGSTPGWPDHEEFQRNQDESEEVESSVRNAGTNMLPSTNSVNTRPKPVNNTVVNPASSFYDSIVDTYPFLKSPHNSPTDESYSSASEVCWWGKPYG